MSTDNNCRERQPECKGTSMRARGKNGSSDAARARIIDRLRAAPAVRGGAGYSTTTAGMLVVLRQLSSVRPLCRSAISRSATSVSTSS